MQNTLQPALQIVCNVAISVVEGVRGTRTASEVVGEPAPGNNRAMRTAPTVDIDSVIRAVDARHALGKGGA